MRPFAPIFAALATATLIAPAADARSPLPSAAAAAEQQLPHISVQTIGRGSPVVLIPGLGSPRAVWDGVVPALARDHRVFLVQVNGFGGDSPGANLKPGILDGIVADLSAFLTAEKVGPVRLVGHSMGGLASLMFARAHPHQVERLMIVDALPYFPVLLARDGVMPTPEQIAGAATMMRDQVAARFGKPVDPATVKADVDGLALKPESRRLMSAWAASADPRVTAGLLYEDMTTDMRPALPDLAMPITVITPWSDSAFGEARTAAFYRRQYAGTPNVSFVGIAEAGHMVMLDQPALFAAALGAFAK
ncbi:MAG: alpha/beta hydrolase [Sphingomicrobium sp.]